MAPWRLIGTARPHRRILFAVLVVELVLFGGYRYQWWRWARDPSRPGTMLGDGLTVRGDGLGYYAWLRSLLIDGDWSFDNEFDAYNAVGDGVQPALPRTRLGCRVNPYSVGPACAWSLAVVPGHFALHLLQRVGVRCVTDGYAWPYQLLVGGASLLFAGLGLGFLYGICRRYARPERAALAAAMLTLGTTIVYYSAAEVSMAHGLGTAVTAALVWYWLRTWGSTDPKRWLLVGGLVGLAALARWQLAALAVLPAGEAVLACGRAWRRVGTILARLALAGAASLAAFLPQMVAWRCVYGDWLVAPMPLAHNWLEPNWFRVLLAQDRSLFYWTPLTLLPLLGYLTCFRPGWQPPVLPNIFQSCRKSLFLRIRAALIRSFAHTQVRTRSKPRTQAGSGARPPPNDVALP